MNLNNWAEFWDMGGHGLYVWGAFGAVALAFLVEVMQIHQRQRAMRDNASWRAGAGTKEATHEGQN